MKVLHYIAYLIVYGLWFLMSLLPFRVLYWISDFLSFLLIYIFRYRHQVVWKNLSECFPEKDKREIRKIEKGFYHWFCDYLVETIKLMTISKKSLMKHMTFTGMEEFNKTLSEGQSCAVYLGHYGNWEWITSLSYWVPEQVLCTQLYHPLENQYFDRLFKDVRERQQGVCIPMKESIRKIISLTKEGKTLVVGFIADQAPMWNNIHHWVDFLHHETPVLTGSEKIVQRMKMAAFYGDVTSRKRGYYNCEMKLMTYTPQEMEEFKITNLYFELLEETIKKVPHLWLWSHNRFKRTREEFDRLFEVTKEGKVVWKDDEMRHANSI